MVSLFLYKIVTSIMRTVISSEVQHSREIYNHKSYLIKFPFFGNQLQYKIVLSIETQ